MQRLLALVVLGVLVSLASGLTGDTFTVNCVPLTQQRSDPIVQPGIASAHVHAVAGGNAFSRSMPGVYSAFDATATTCNKALDHSNYWIPQLYHYANGQYTLVKFLGSAHYYQKRACDYKAGLNYCNKTNNVDVEVPLAFPYGFRMVAGDPFRRSQNNSDFTNRAILMMCMWSTGSFEAPGFPTRPCDMIRAEVYFPSCWDGVNIDSPDHQSHVAYPAAPYGDYNGGVCPKSHPVALMSLFYEFFFDTSVYGNDITHFAWSCGDPTGYGLHGDFIMGWTNRALLQTAHADCVTASDCPTLGNQATNPQTLIVPAPNEDIGQNGAIPALPGNNPIVWTTEGGISVNHKGHTATK